jgi:hypothetical protein
MLTISLQKPNCLPTDLKNQGIATHATSKAFDNTKPLQLNPNPSKALHPFATLTSNKIIYPLIKIQFLPIYLTY